MKKFKDIRKIHLASRFESLIKQKTGYLSALNGVIGDTLEKKKSRLAIPMSFHNSQGVFSFTPASTQPDFEKSKKICILVHGSCNSEKDWNFKENRSANYGSLLHAELGYVPLFLRYNSGLHISINGKRLSALLEKLVRHHPKADDIILIGHSMGGLVLRSACHYGKKEKRRWVRRVKKIFYLGTPHLGTHLEKLGKIATVVLSQIPNFITKAIVTLGDLRSDGIKDLRYGYLTDEDWKKRTTHKLFSFRRQHIPLLKKIDHYLICSTLSKVANSRIGRFIGDGLVHPASALGQGWFESSTIPFLKNHCRVFTGLSHSNLQRDRRVYEQIKEWCG